VLGIGKVVELARFATPQSGSALMAWARHVSCAGRTELDNLLLICSFHHRLVHEHGWSVKRSRDGMVRWFDAAGVRYPAGPSPPGNVNVSARELFDFEMAG
jgi:hypothetical protein